MGKAFVRIEYREKKVDGRTVKLPPKVGEVIGIKTMMRHPMNTGLAKDPTTKKTIPRHIVNSLKATFNGKDVFSTVLYPSVSKNPYVAFKLKVPGSGDLVVTWTEDGGKVTNKTVKITAE